MKCKKHTWLFASKITRQNERSTYWKERADLELRDGTVAKTFAVQLAIAALDYGRKYVCADCDKTKEVF